MPTGHGAAASEVFRDLEDLSRAHPALVGVPLGEGAGALSVDFKSSDLTAVADDLPKSVHDNAFSSVALASL